MTNEPFGPRVIEIARFLAPEIEHRDAVSLFEAVAENPLRITHLRDRSEHD